MVDNEYIDPKAPFNMAVATLMSLRQTLDAIRNIESKLEYPPDERQRIKIELVKRFFVDSSPLLSDGQKDNSFIKLFMPILDLQPCRIIKGNKKRAVIKYSFELNKVLDNYLLQIQIELQRKKYYMPPRDDMGSMVGRMN